MSQKSRRRPSTGLERYAGYGAAWVLAAVLGGWAGLELDRRLGTEPFLMVLGIFAGAGAGLYTLYVRLVVEPAHREDKDNDE